MKKSIENGQDNTQKCLDTLDTYADFIINMLLNKQLDVRTFQKALNGVFN